MALDLTDQYRTSAKLDARRNLHLKYDGGQGQASLAETLEIAPGSRVLEVGCGPGKFWPPIAARLPADLSITLTDLSPGMLEEALATVRGVGRWADVGGEVADVCALPFADERFDVVLGLYMLYHAGDRDLAIREIRRVLRPGGRAILSTNGENNLAAIDSLRRRAFPDAGRDRMSDSFTLENGEPLVRRHFADVTLRRSRDELAVTDPADIVAYITSYPPGDAANADELARLQRLTDEAFAAGGGVFRVIRDTGLIEARKLAG
jgi:ubiquinone/menaquinone biosynthesis C-methylase UbiE